MNRLEKFMYSLHCSQVSWETLCQMYLDKETENEGLKKEEKKFRDEYEKLEVAYNFMQDNCAGKAEEIDWLERKGRNYVGIEAENKRLKEIIQYIFDEIDDEYSDENIYPCEEALSSVLYLVSNIYKIVAQILK